MRFSRRTIIFVSNFSLCRLTCFFFHVSCIWVKLYKCKHCGDVNLLAIKGYSHESHKHWSPTINDDLIHSTRYLLLRSYLPLQQEHWLQSRWRRRCTPSQTGACSGHRASSVLNYKIIPNENRKLTWMSNILFTKPMTNDLWWYVFT